MRWKNIYVTSRLWSCARNPGYHLEAIADRPGVTSSRPPSPRPWMTSSPSKTRFTSNAKCLIRWLFHQHFTSRFLVWKCFAKLFSNYNLALLFFGKRIMAQKLHIKCWWNRLQVTTQQKLNNCSECVRDLIRLNETRYLFGSHYS